MENNVSGLEECTKTILDSLGLYIKLFLLFYADDTVIIAENPDSLQRALDVFSLYCYEWKLHVNTSKSKIVIFCKRKNKKITKFVLCGEDIEIVDNYVYLGIKFSYNGRFCTAKKQLIKQATKAMYGIFRKARRLDLPVDIQLKLFDSLVLPILMYCCEVWGFEKLEDIEKVHLTFCKRILCVKNSTPNFMIYGELGRFPLKNKIYSRIINYWKRNIDSKEQKLSVIIYKVLFFLYKNDVFKS